MKRIRTIELWDKVKYGKVECEVDDAFVLGVMPEDVAPSTSLCGLNVAIVFAKKGRKAKDEHISYVVDAISNCCVHGDVTLYLKNNVGTSIPVDVHGGNCWSDPKNGGMDYGYDKESCCFFGYVNPLMFDTNRGGEKWNERTS